MDSDRYLLKRFGLLGFLFGGKRGEETPDSQSAVGQPPTGQPVGGQDLAEAIKKLLDEAYEESGSPTTNIGMWQELRSLMEKDDSVKGAIKAAQEGNYDEMCNHLEKLKSKLEKFASQQKVNPGLERVIQSIKSKIDELIRKAREKSLHKR
jgi:predicted RNase H-like nuclease (RuvC/YqgF family)